MVNTHTHTNACYCLSLSLSTKGSDALKITASKRVRNKGKSSHPSPTHLSQPHTHTHTHTITDIVLLEAFLCRLGRVDRVRHHFTSLPLLLSRGPLTLSSQLQEWLQASFDCHISPHTLESGDLSLLAGQFATAEKSETEITVAPGDLSVI